MCLLLAACDPTFHRTKTFSLVDAAVSAELSAGRLNRVAEQHGFEPWSSVRTQPDPAPQSWTVVQYHAAIREPNWGSCRLVLLRDDSSATIVLELAAFPANGEPLRLRDFRLAIEALLTRFGYAADP